MSRREKLDEVLSLLANLELEDLEEVAKATKKDDEDIVTTVRKLDGSKVADIRRVTLNISDEPLVGTVSLEPDRVDDEVDAFAGIQALQRLVHKTANDAGWYKDPATGQPVERNFGEVVMLMVTELAEAVEADRKGLMDDKLTHRDGREVEFADCIIRILDTAAALGLDVAGAIIEKNRYNKSRLDHKLENRKNGGKRY